MIRIRPAAVGLFCLVALVRPAAAQLGHVPNTWEVYSRDQTRIERATVIHLADIDLSTAAGVQQLLVRIEDASAAVCGGPASAYSDASRQAYAACRERAVADAVARMRLPALTRLAARAAGGTVAAR